MPDDAKGTEGIEGLSEAAQDGATKFASQAKDLQTLHDAVVDAASVSAGLWFTYLVVFYYFLISVGSVTHRDLFLENAVRLPFLNVDLPLVGFFLLGPVAFFILHVYVLLHFVLLADKVGVFDAELRDQIHDPDARARLRRQLPSNIFVQVLAGPSEVRTGVVGLLLRLIAWISLVFGPLALLVFFQIQFLPYHNAPIAWWQRGIVVADLALLWMFWPSVARGTRTRIALSDFRNGKPWAATVASVVLLWMVIGVATFPGERLERSLCPERPDATPCPLVLRPTKALRRWMVGGPVDLIARRATSPWSHSLVLPGFDVIERAKVDKDGKIVLPPETLKLQDRSLERVVLVGARLRKADFTAGNLQDADLSRADLQGTVFACGETGRMVPRPPPKRVGDAEKTEDAEKMASAEKTKSDEKAGRVGIPATRCVQLQRALFDRAQLQGASLLGAQLQSASLFGAQLQGATLDGAELKSADLRGANLEGATLASANLQDAKLGNAQLQRAILTGANLQGASLSGADFRGATLGGAKLQRTSLSGVDLRGASLDGAQLQGASLVGADLQGASLVGADLQGASLDKARLQGASLGGAQLQGASLDKAQLQGASLDKAQLQGASLDGADLQGASLDGAQLQGTSLDDAKLIFASLDQIFSWRTDPRKASLKGARVIAPRTSPELSPEVFSAWERTIKGEVWDDKLRDRALKNIGRVDPALSFPAQNTLADAWARVAKSSSALGVDAYEKNLAASLRETGCRAENAPYVIQGLSRNVGSRFVSKDNRELQMLTAAFLDTHQCPGAEGLPKKDRDTLRKMKRSP